MGLARADHGCALAEMFELLRARYTAQIERRPDRSGSDRINPNLSDSEQRES